MTDVTAVNYGDEAHTLLHKRIDQEATQRQAGDNAVSAKADSIRGSVDTTRNELTTEGKLRAEGDLLSDAYYRKLRKDSTDNWAEGKKDNASLDSKLTKHIGINSGSITELNQLMYAAREEFINALSAISVQHETDINLMDKRIKKYETMLQDITADSHQITADNGQVPLGAWTILSQAREWDLAIIANLKAHTEDKEKEVNEALEDIKNNLPDVEKIINEAMDDLSNHPVITELDKLIGGLGQDAEETHAAILKEQQDRVAAQIAEAVERARLIEEATDKLVADITKEHDDRVDALLRESEIRRQQLLKEAENRADELIKTTDQLHTALSKETEERIAHVKTVEDGLTVEIASRISGDQTLNTKLETLKSSTETSLAAVTNSMESMASDVAANATAITAVDSRLKVTDSELKKTTDLAASASRKAESAVDATTSQGKIIDGIETSLEELSTGVESSNKATASAVSGLQSDVKRNKDGVEANNSSITSLRGDVSTLNGTVKGHTSAVSSLESTQKTQGDNITQVVRDTKLLTNEVTAIKGDMSTKVDSAAFKELNSTVTKQGTDIRTHNSEITKLNSTVETQKGQISAKADSSAVQVLENRVTSHDGQIKVANEYTLALKGRVDTHDGQIAQKADSAVLVKYYNKEEANKAIAGQVQKYDSELVVAATNIIPTLLSFWENGWYDTNDGTEQGFSYSHVRSRAALDIVIVPQETYTVRATNTRVVVLLYSQDKLLVSYVNKPRNVFEQEFITPADAKYIRYFLFDPGTDVGKTLTQEQLDACFIFVYQGKKRNKAAWVPSSIGVGDALKANATAIKETNTEVTKSKAGITAVSSDLTKLTGRVGKVEGDVSKKADGSAVQSLTLKVEEQGKDISTHSTALTKLEGKVDISTGNIAKKADSSALQLLDNKVVAVDGRVVANTNATTALKGRVDTVESGLSKKADSSVLVKYSTKEEAGKAVSDGVAKYDAQLVIGGDNLLTNSKEKFRRGAASGVPAGASYTIEGGKIKIVGGFISTYYGWYNENSNLPSLSSLTHGEMYTISFYVQAVDPSKSPVNVKIGCHLNDPNSYQASDVTVGTFKSGGIVRLDKTRHVNNNLAGLSPHIHITGDSIGGGLYIVAWKITRGTKGTDWTDNADAVSSGIVANATAIQNTKSTVEEQDTKITANTTNINAVTARINDPKTGLQANAGATASLSGRVTKTEQGIVAQGNRLDTVSATANAAIYGVERIVDATGLDANTYYPVTINTNKSHRSKISILVNLDRFSAPWSTHNSGTYALTLVWTTKGSGWGANPVERIIESFGYAWTTQSPVMNINQLGNSSNEHVYVRGGTKYAFYLDEFLDAPTLHKTATSIAGQEIKPIPYNAALVPKSIQSAVNANAAYTSEVNAKAEQADGKAASAISKIDTLSSTVGSNTASIQRVDKSVDGVMAVSTVSVDNNGFMTGYGLISKLVNGVVVSSFGVNADMFYVGTSNSNKRKPFMVLTKPQTVINGNSSVTYPAGTWIDTALIANATIGTAHIADLAVTNAQIAHATIQDAKIANLNAAKITAGFLNAQRIQAGSIEADKLSTNAINTISIKARNATFIGSDGSKQVITGGVTRMYYPSGKLAMEFGVI